MTVKAAPQTLLRRRSFATTCDPRYRWLWKAPAKSLILPMWPGRYVDAMTQRLGTTQGNPTRTQTLVGPAYLGDGTGDRLEFPGRDTTAHPNITMAAVLRWGNVTGTHIYMENANDSTGYRLFSDGTTLFFSKAGVNDYNSGLSIALNILYFVLFTYRALDGQYHWFVKNLQTGAVSTVSATQTSTPVAPTGTYVVGGSSGFPNAGFSGAMAMAYIAERYLTLDQAHQWSRDPLGLFRVQRPRSYKAGSAASGIPAGILSELDDEDY